MMFAYITVGMFCAIIYHSTNVEIDLNILTQTLAIGTCITSFVVSMNTAEERQHLMALFNMVACVTILYYIIKYSGSRWRTGLMVW